MKGFWRDLFVALFVPMALGIAVAAACYATTGPTPTCAQDPNGPGCYGGLHDMKAADAGR